MYEDVSAPTPMLCLFRNKVKIRKIFNRSMMMMIISTPGNEQPDFERNFSIYWNQPVKTQEFLERKWE